MATKAFEQLNKRLEDIDSLLKAHTSLSQFTRIEAATTGHTDIVRALSALQRGFTGPLRGRRWGMAALNRAGIVLLSAHLEGYIEDLFEESSTLIASAVFDTKYYDLNAFVSQATDRFRNPTPQNVKDLFVRLGLSDVLANVHWGTLSNNDVRNRLGDLVRLRNRIAHGEQPGVTRKQLRQEVIFVRHLARNLDKRLYDYTLRMAGVNLW